MPTFKPHVNHGQPKNRFHFANIQHCFGNTI